MKKQMLAGAAAAVMVLGGGAIANAESQTVQGSGDVKKIVADNGQDAITTKVFGLGKPCGGAKQLSVNILTRGGEITYFAQAGCYGGTTWAASLLYTPTGDIQDQTIVRCRNFEVSRNRDTGAYRVFMPRGCLDEAPNRIRVSVEGLNYAGSPMGGSAGPTKLLGRG